MAEQPKGGDQHQFKTWHPSGEHGLTAAHLQFIQEVMDEFQAGEFMCVSREMPSHLPDLLDNLYGPAAGDAPVLLDEVVWAHRPGRETILSRCVDRPPRPARFMVIIGLANQILWTAYGSLRGEIAPHEVMDHYVIQAGGCPEASARFWYTEGHALSLESVKG
jgi:hypothetical protein